MEKKQHFDAYKIYIDGKKYAVTINDFVMEGYPEGSQDEGYVAYCIEDVTTHEALFQVYVPISSFKGPDITLCFAESKITDKEEQNKVFCYLTNKIIDDCRMEHAVEWDKEELHVNFQCVDKKNYDKIALNGAEDFIRVLPTAKAFAKGKPKESYGNFVELPLDIKKLRELNSKLGLFREDYATRHP